MKQIYTMIVLILGSIMVQAKHNSNSEHYGNTLNIGLGIGYYSYIHNVLPIAIINYEFDVAPSFTLAPFVGFYSYRNNKFGNNNSPNGYTYRETVAPIGVKGFYYFDNLLHANPNWDFYAAGSLAFIVRRVTWDANYYGTHNVYRNVSPIYLDLHVGAEYHFTNRAGLFLDISTGVSTIGLALKL